MALLEEVGEFELFHVLFLEETEEAMSSSEFSLKRQERRAPVCIVKLMMP